MVKKRRRQGRLQVVNPDCAGIDIGKDVHYVAVPVGQCNINIIQLWHRRT